MSDSPTQPVRPEPTEASPAAKKRLDWVDAGKGLSILGVVTFHAVVRAETWEGLAGEITDLLTPVRLPLFFLLSGLFSHRIRELSLLDLITRRLWFLVVPYVIWSLLFGAERYLMDPEAYPAYLIWQEILLPTTGLWFLHALVVFTILAWLTKWLPGWLTVLLSFLPLLGLANPDLAQVWIFHRCVAFLPIFMLGLHARSAWFWLAERAFRWWAVVLALACFFLAFGLYRGLQEWGEMALDPATLHAVLITAECGRALIALPTGVVLAVAVSRTGWVSDALAYLGRRTLPIFVSHEMLIFAIYGFGPFYERTMTWLHTWVTPASTEVLLVTAMCIAVGLLVDRLSKVPVLGWIVTPPSLRPKDRGQVR
ncbi:acyltransferase family protein [Parenemella sanctibonifatiensis]|uniref:Acyltransferase 3 domain-containing protein n=1 Tax=Parenemella sanctibonifatiensis TaxID=2016505 RepID=A0A255EKX1_9ACTN|nr:acyltransferase family protein [Parenemella sanctibonifatiensis]OYN88783.1 hypothetical protein CGZ92_03505 [Parenemella sanctibonifatiensis]